MQVKFNFNIILKSGNHAATDGTLSNVGHLPTQLSCTVSQHFSWIESRINFE